MRLLRLQDVEIGPNDRVSHHARLRGFCCRRGDRHRAQPCYAMECPGESAATLFWARVQFVEDPLQLFPLLPGLAELALRRQTLVVGKVSGGFRDERGILTPQGRDSQAR
jgi:hypothetical protein